MKIIKEYCQAAKKCVIRSTSYADSFGYFKMLIDEAKKDIPNVQEDNIKIVHFGGRHYKFTYGIEINCQACPEGYNEIHELENTL